MCSQDNIAEPGIDNAPRIGKPTGRVIPRGQHLCYGNRATLTSLLVFLAVCSIGQRAATCETVEEQVATHFRLGEEALKHGEFVRATEEFKTVLALDPGLLEAQVNLGLAYHAVGEYSLAVRYLTRALRKAPNLVGPNVVVGIEYLRLGSPDKAIPTLRHALQLDPSNREAHRVLATCYQNEDDYREAADQYRQVAELEPDKSRAWFNLGHDYLNLSARLAYRGARLYQHSAWGHRFLGDMLAQRNRWNDAALEYRQGVDLEPKQPGLHTALGQAYLHAGKLEAAETEFHLELGTDGENETAWLGLAETQLARGLPALALEAVGRVWQISPEFLALQQEFPTIELSSDASKGLLTDLQSAPEGAAKHFVLCGVYEAAGETAQAHDQWAAFQADFAAWQKAEQRRAGGTVAQYPCRLRRYLACAQLLETRKQLGTPEQLLLGKTRLTLRQYDRAGDTFAKLLAVDNGNVEASYWLARAYYALGADCYDRLTELFPDSWRAHQLRGEGYKLREAEKDAIREYQIALRLQPNEPELHEALGQLFLNKKSYDEARAELEKSLVLDPSRASTLCLLGRLYVGKHETEKAVQYLQKALRYRPDMVEASGLLGTAYVRLGEDAKALPELERAAPFDFYGDMHYQLALAYRKLGKVELANKALARSQELRRTSAAKHEAMVSGVAEVE
jgi:tetratricopeptide (TPR) repeat protein